MLLLRGWLPCELGWKLVGEEVEEEKGKVFICVYCDLYIPII